MKSAVLVSVLALSGGTAWLFAATAQDKPVVLQADESAEWQRWRISMDAQATIRRADFPPTSYPLGPKLARTMTSSLLASLALAGLLICVRRAGGALVEPLSAPVLVGLGGLLTLAAIAFRAALPATSLRVGRRTHFWIWFPAMSILRKFKT